MSLTNLDMTDREMLHVIHSCLNEDGWTDSKTVAEAMGVRPTKTRSAAGLVSTRMAWMRRNGLVERMDPKQVGGRSKDRLWLITPFGDEIRRGRLRRNIEQFIEDAEPGSAVLMMRQITRRAYVQASYELATAVRREYLHNVAQRPR